MGAPSGAPPASQIWGARNAPIFFLFFYCRRRRRQLKKLPKIVKEPFVAPPAPPLGHLRHPFGKPSPSAAIKEKKKNWYAPSAPYLGRRGCLTRGAHFISFYYYQILTSNKYFKTRINEKAQLEET